MGRKGRNFLPISTVKKYCYAGNPHWNLCHRLSIEGTIEDPLQTLGIAYLRDVEDVLGGP